MSVVDQQGMAFEYVHEYMVIDEPVIFVGNFIGQSQLYVGLMVEEFDSGDFGAPQSELYKNYVLAAVNPGMVERLHKGELALADAYDDADTLWVSHRTNVRTGKESHIHARYRGMFPGYVIPREATLSPI